jgi:hypothetical protein
MHLGTLPRAHYSSSRATTMRRLIVLQRINGIESTNASL